MVFSFSSVILQVSLNDGKTFVSSNVTVTAKNCTPIIVPEKKDEHKEETKEEPKQVGQKSCFDIMNSVVFSRM